MGTINAIQASFGAGELSPFLYGRVDLAKYHVGARTMLNMFVHPHGGASNRPGTKYVGNVDDHTVRHRLIPFRFRSSPSGQNYALLFGNLTMQVVMAGGLVQLPTTAITGITQANPGVVTAVAHGYTTGTRVPIAGVAGMTQVNGQTFTITVLTANTFSIGVDTTAYTAYSSGGTAGGGAFTLVSPYAAADLARLKFVQSADTMTFTHPSYAPRSLTRTGHAAWTFTIITFAPGVSAPTGLAPASPGAGGSILVVTAINDNTGEESLPSSSAQSTLTSDTWTWTAVAGCSAYNVYKKSGSLFGFIAQSGTNSFQENAFTPNIGHTPPGSRNPFTGAGEWPGCSTYYQQRQVYAGSANKPQNLWFSVTGGFNNMNVSQPTQDSDAITRALVSREVNEIRHLVPGSSLLLMTSGAEWRCYPGQNANGLSPAACVTLPQSAYGCSHVPPVSAGSAVLFWQERGSRMRELKFDVLQDQYQAQDMSVLAQHLLYDTTNQYTIDEAAFAEEPFRIVWQVRSDGVLLGFTYMREHEVYAWHRHTTAGVVESVCSIPESEGNSLLDAVYLIVNRTIGGVTKRYIERMAPRTFATIADAWFVDCGLQYSGAPVTSVSGLDHLEGKTVAILGDGSVVPSAVVTGGVVPLDGSYSKVTVGLPYTADLESLNLELPVNGTVQGQMKKIGQVTVRVKDARGIQVGLNQNILQEVKQRTTETLGTAMQPFSGDFAISIPSEWNRDGRLFVRQSYPLPCTILDLIPEVQPGD